VGGGEDRNEKLETRKKNKTPCIPLDEGGQKNFFIKFKKIFDFKSVYPGIMKLVMLTPVYF
jgi:hypothetical protein